MPKMIQVIKTAQDTYERYDFVWTAAGEDGLQTGRACILDDGNYHYALSAMAEENPRRYSMYRSISRTETVCTR